LPRNLCVMTSSPASIAHAARFSSDEATLQRVVALLGSDDPAVRAAGVDILGWFGLDPVTGRAMHGDAVVEALVPRLGAERDPDILALVIDVLCRRGAQERMQGAIVPLSRHGNANVRAAAAVALDGLRQAS
jgi:hypothetical protein